MPIPIYTAGFRQSLLRTKIPFGLQLQDYFEYSLTKRFHRPLLSMLSKNIYYLLFTAL